MNRVCRGAGALGARGAKMRRPLLGRGALQNFGGAEIQNAPSTGNQHSLLIKRLADLTIIVLQRYINIHDRPTLKYKNKLWKNLLTIPDKDLKAKVASMKADAKARFSEVVDVADDREFWRKGKASASVVLSWISSKWLIVIIPALERLITRTSS